MGRSKRGGCMFLVIYLIHLRVLGSLGWVDGCVGKAWEVGLEVVCIVLSMVYNCRNCEVCPEF